MGSNVPVMKESVDEMIYEMNHTYKMNQILIKTVRIIASLDFISAVQ